jgi:hypothetical protein
MSSNSPVKYGADMRHPADMHHDKAPRGNGFTAIFSLSLRRP